MSSVIFRRWTLCWMLFFSFGPLSFTLLPFSQGSLGSYFHYMMSLGFSAVIMMDSRWRGYLLLLWSACIRLKHFSFTGATQDICSTLDLAAALIRWLEGDWVIWSAGSLWQWMASCVGSEPSRTVLIKLWELSLAVYFLSAGRDTFNAMLPFQG